MQTTHFEGGIKDSDQYLDLTIMDQEDLMAMDDQQKQSLMGTCGLSNDKLRERILSISNVFASIFQKY